MEGKRLTDPEVRSCIVCPRLHPKQQRPQLVERPQACQECRTELLALLRDVGEYYALLPDTLERGMVTGQRVSGGGTDAMLPFLEDVWDLLLPISPQPVTDLYGDQVGYSSVKTVLTGWIELWRDERALGEVGSGSWVDSMVEWLSNRLEWACDRSSSVDDFAGEISQLAKAMRRFVATEAPKPEPCLGVPCRRCDLTTLARLANGTGDVECQNPECRAVYRPDEYDRWTRLIATYAKRNRRRKPIQAQIAGVASAATMTVQADVQESNPGLRRRRVRSGRTSEGETK